MCIWEAGVGGRAEEDRDDVVVERRRIWENRAVYWSVWDTFKEAYRYGKGLKVGKVRILQWGKQVIFSCFFPCLSLFWHPFLSFLLRWYHSVTDATGITSCNTIHSMRTWIQSRQQKRRAGTVIQQGNCIVAPSVWPKLNEKTNNPFHMKDWNSELWLCK